MPSKYDTLRLEALPYARRIVEAHGWYPDRFNQADIAHEVDLVASAIASTAVTRGHSVLETVERVYPELFGAHPPSADRAASLRPTPLRGSAKSHPLRGALQDAPGLCFVALLAGLVVWS